MPGTTSLPEVEEYEEVAHIIQKFYHFISEAVVSPHSFEELRVKSPGHVLQPLIEHLATTVHNLAVICALLALRGHYAQLYDDDGRHLNLTRAYACEVVAWRFSNCLTADEAMEYLLFEIPPLTAESDEADDPEAVPRHGDRYRDSVETNGMDEQALMIDGTAEVVDRGADPYAMQRDSQILTSTLQGLNALEIAAVSDAKDFLTQSSIQGIVDGIWVGDIVLWNEVSVHAEKKPRRHNPKTDDPYCRLRVPRYLKIYEVFFFAVFLVLYYRVLVQRDLGQVTTVEVFLWIWLASFAYDEFGQYTDAGLAFYIADFWSLWDFGIVFIGLAYFITRMIGLGQQNDHITDQAFDILSLEALLLVPRTCSLATLHPFFGPLIPCLKEMTKYAAQFLALVVVLYLGFLTTFTLLARDNFTPVQMSWILIKVFFGSSYLGFDAADQISPVLGAPLMLVFVFLSNILLLTALISLLSNSLEEIMKRSRVEYLFIYSVFVLEASTSNRLTYYLPPLNLISLLLRPLRFCLPSESMRSLRIRLLKIIHMPHIALIRAYEALSPELIRQFRMATSTGYQDTKKISKNSQPHSRLIGSPLRRLNTRFSSLAEPNQRTSRVKPRMNPTAQPQDLDDRSLIRLHSKIDQMYQRIEQLIASQSDATGAD